ncbi:MAG: hypothetical protein HY738_09465, partial [Bacteroidia bacterium]|nr:hypothetical protein [Bacteroidia bacterium]
MKKIALKPITTAILICLSTIRLYAMDTLVVTKTTDVDPFVYPYNYVDTLCSPEMYGTLQWAFRKANDTPGLVIIVFAIPGQDPYIIYLYQQLPHLTKTLIIDGTTQAGWEPGKPAIIVNGQGIINAGITISQANNSIIKGIQFDYFTDCGIYAYGCAGFTFTGNVITRINNSSPINAVSGVRFGSCTGLTVKGNFIGTDYELATDKGIKDHGLYYDWGTNQSITGGTSSGEGNTIAYCGSNGFGILDGTGHLISGNRIFNNYRAILMRPGVNNDKQPPVITSFAGNTITGTSQPGDIIEVFGSTGDQNANEYLASITVDGVGNWNANISYVSWDYLIATATDVQNNTSELSYAFENTVIPPTPQINKGYNLNGPITNPVTGEQYIPPMYVYDRFGDSTLLENITITHYSEIAGIFRLNFVEGDDNPALTTGFNDQSSPTQTEFTTLGAERRAVLIR